MRQVAKKLSLWLPPIKKLVSQRNSLIEERARLLGELKRFETTLLRTPRKPWVYPELSAVEVAAYRHRIQQENWFHSMNLGNGLVTEGAASVQALDARIDSLCLPESLAGMSFLDIGAWDGFYSFEAEQRQAKRVLATDSLCWTEKSKQTFLLAREILRSKVEDMDIDIMDISPERVGRFDIVLFSGVLYHMRDPIKALSNAASVTTRMLVVESAVGFEHIAEPVMGYLPRVPGNEPSNFWRPNSNLVKLWLKELGFDRIECRIREEGPGAQRGFFNAIRLR
jgi:tRNA (mo5U34)-methyltransferase